TVDSFPTLLAGLPPLAPLQGGLSAEWRDVQLAGPMLRSGNVLVLSDNLSWDGVPLSQLQLAANILDNGEVRIAGDATLDQHNHLRLAGRFVQETRRYEAQASVHLA